MWFCNTRCAIPEGFEDLPGIFPHSHISFLKHCCFVSGRESWLRYATADGISDDVSDDGVRWSWWWWWWWDILTQFTAGFLFLQSIINSTPGIQQCSGSGSISRIEPQLMVDRVVSIPGQHTGVNTGLVTCEHVENFFSTLKTLLGKTLLSS